MCESTYHQNHFFTSKETVKGEKVDRRKEMITRGGERERDKEHDTNRRERRKRGEEVGEKRERERGVRGIPKAKQLPTLPARRGHIFTPQNVGRRTTA